MCLIIASPYGTLASNEVITNAWSHNDDGWGLMVARDGKTVEVWRGMSLKGLKAKLSEAESFPHAIHFRFGTHGNRRAIQNCHPFPVGSGMFLMHNGIINGIPIIHPTLSDTWHLAALMKASFATRKALRASLTDVGKEIGKGNKLVLLAPDGVIDIVNESAGAWENGIWYSNEYSKYPTHTTYYGDGIYAYGSMGSGKTESVSPHGEVKTAKTGTCGWYSYQGKDGIHHHYYYPGAEQKPAAPMAKSVGELCSAGTDEGVFKGSCVTGNLDLYAGYFIRDRSVNGELLPSVVRADIEKHNDIQGRAGFKKSEDNTVFWGDHAKPVPCVDTLGIQPTNPAAWSEI